MSATTVPAFIDALVLLLSNRTGLAGVPVYGCPVPPEMLGKNAIELADLIDVTQEPAAMSSSTIAETYPVKGSILVSVPMAPGIDKTATINAAASAARTQALAIYEEVADALDGDDTVSGTVLGASVGGMSIEQGFAPEGQLGRTCRVEFTIDVQARPTP